MEFDIKNKIKRLLNSAKSRKIHVNLDVNKYELLLKSGCHYCGSSLHNEKGYCLDRVDSSKGYTITNLVACCKICNYAKRNMSVDDFVSWLLKASEHTQKVLNQLKNDINNNLINENSETEFYLETLANKPKNRIKYVP